MSGEGEPLRNTWWGFEWGAATVTRMASHKGKVWLSVSGKGRGAPVIDISVSPGGKSVRVWKNGEELT